MNGTLLAFIEARKHSYDDHGYVGYFPCFARLRVSIESGRLHFPVLFPRNRPIIATLPAQSSLRVSVRRLETRDSKSQNFEI